jgi:hypothetical protein
MWRGILFLHSKIWEKIWDLNRAQVLALPCWPVWPWPSFDLSCSTTKQALSDVGFRRPHMATLYCLAAAEQLRTLPRPRPPRKPVAVPVRAQDTDPIVLPSTGDPWPCGQNLWVDGCGRRAWVVHCHCLVFVEMSLRTVSLFASLFTFFSWTVSCINANWTSVLPTLQYSAQHRNAWEDAC